VPVDRLETFYHKFYQPDNAVLVITGRLDESRALGFVADTLGRIPRPTRKLEQTYTVEPPQEANARRTAPRGRGAGSDCGLPRPATGHADSAALQFWRA